MPGAVGDVKGIEDSWLAGVHNPVFIKEQS